MTIIQPRNELRGGVLTRNCIRRPAGYKACRGDPWRLARRQEAHGELVWPKGGYFNNFA